MGLTEFELLFLLLYQWKYHFSDIFPGKIPPLQLQKHTLKPYFFCLISHFLAGLSGISAYFHIRLHTSVNRLHQRKANMTLDN